MARGLTDLPEEPTTNQDDNEELNQVISDLIMGQNKLHDRIIDLERKLDHLTAPREATSRSEARRFKVLGL